MAIQIVRACLSLTLLVCFASSSLACFFDADCRFGSRCLKGSGQIYGVCAGGRSPGNQNDRRPVYAPLDLDRTYGNTCSFDLDCGTRNRCLKSGGSFAGVCVSGPADGSGVVRGGGAAPHRRDIRRTGR
jgi:hypothetical protein